MFAMELLSSYPASKVFVIFIICLKGYESKFTGTNVYFISSKDRFSKDIIEPVHEISNSVVCATSKASDQPAHTRSLFRAFASHLSIL